MRRTRKLNDFFTDEDADLDGPPADRNRSADELAASEGRAIGAVAVVPTLTDGVIILNRHTDDDIADHVAGEDEETAPWFGWWPQTSTEDGVRDAFRQWSHSWRTPTRKFAARDAATGRLVGGC